MPCALHQCFGPIELISKFLYFYSICLFTAFGPMTVPLITKTTTPPIDCKSHFHY